MRTVRILACLVAVLAVSAVATASAAASPEFDAATYPAETKGTATNPQGFNGGGVVIVCPEATFNSNEEIGNDPEAEALNSTKNTPTTIVHPNYGNAPLPTKCKGTLVAGTFTVEVKTKFCNYRVHAVKPGELTRTGTVDIVCEKLLLSGEVTATSNVIKGLSSTAKLQANFTVTGTGIPAGTTVTKVNSATEVEISNLATVTGKPTLTFKSPGIENVFLGLTGCTITVFPQTVKGLDFKNEPKAGTAEQEVTTESEVGEIKSKATGGCGLGIGEAEFKAEYRKGKIKAGPPETAEIEPLSNPALSVAKGVVPGTSTIIAGEVGINEAHWYENHVVLPASLEGTKILMWGKQTLAQTNGEIGGVCQTLWGGNAFNAGGGGPPPGGGMGAAGEVRIDDFRAYDCNEATLCETTNSSKLSVEPEGLGVKVVAGKAEQLHWNAVLSGASPWTLNMGTGAEATQIKWHVECPKTTGGEYNKSWTGEVKPTLENGTSIGSAPSKFTFGTGELKVGAATEGKVTGKLKMMGYEGGEIVSTKNP